MKKHLLLGCLTLLGLTTTAPSAASTFIDADAHGEVNADHLRAKASKNGWVIVQYQQKPYLLNYSHPDYDLSLALNCARPEQTPGYLIEYSSHYRDGSFGGIDFVSARHNDHDKTVFLVDGVSFDDPFGAQAPQLAPFTKALKAGTTLTIEVYDQAFNPDTGNQQLNLNRAIEFKLGQPALLDTVIDCASDE